MRKTAAFSCAVLVALSACDEAAPISQATEVDPGLVDAGRVSTVEPTPPRKRRPKSMLLAEAQERAAVLVADGFLSRQEIVERLIDEAGRESLDDALERLVDEALGEHRRREREWTDVSDADRVTRGFWALQREGFVARERAGDCDTCALAAMEADARALAAKHHAAKGYVYFNDQDVEGISQRGTLHVVVGSFDDEDRQRANVGRVARVFKAVGLHVETMGEEQNVLLLSDLDWRKRRFSRAPQP